MHKNDSFFQSFKHAFAGFVYLIRNEKNAKIHLVATVVVLILASFLALNTIEWLFILVAIFLVWITELLNTALENIFDLLEPRKNHLVKAGKDMSAAAVLFTAILSVIIGIVILVPSLLEKIFSGS